MERPRPPDRNVRPKIRLSINKDRHPLPPPNLLRPTTPFCRRLPPIRAPGALSFGIDVPHSREASSGQLLELVSTSTPTHHPKSQIQV
jgi:hypothetical protein